MECLRQIEVDYKNADYVDYQDRTTLETSVKLNVQKSLKVRKPTSTKETSLKEEKKGGTKNSISLTIILGKFVMKVTFFAGTYGVFRIMKVKMYLHKQWVMS